MSKAQEAVEAEIRKELENGRLERAIDIAAREYYQAVFAFVFRQLGDRRRAEDVTQRTFLEALRTIHNYRGGSIFRTWLLGVANNLCRGSRQSQRRALSFVEVPSSRFPHGFAGPGSSLEQARRARIFSEIVASFSEAAQQLLALRIDEELSYEEIGKRMNLRPNTARKRMHDLIEKIREEYERRTKDPSAGGRPHR